MKKLFFIILFFSISTLTFGTEVYFLNGGTGYVYTDGQTFSSGQYGSYASVYFWIWADPTRYSYDHMGANFQDPDGNWSGWSDMSGGQGLERCLKAGTWHIQGRVYVEADIYGHQHYWMYTSFTLTFYVVDNYAPANPTNLSVSVPGQYQHPIITWNANSEEDLSGYKVYRKIDAYGGIWSVIATVTTNTYTDIDVIGPNMNQKCTYKVNAFDINNNYSGYSNEDYIYGYKIDKKGVGEEKNNQIPNEFSLSQNYPNPFNPSTNINYQVKEKGFVSLKVYDILGKEIANLVNEEKEPGTYSAHFEGANLSSGIYIYSLKINGFTAIKKMSLMK